MKLSSGKGRKDARARTAAPGPLRRSPFKVSGAPGSHYRRKEDTRKLFFVDLYSPLSVAVLIFTVCLSVVDAFLTLTLVGHNAEELNPVMDFFLKLGPFHFIMAKWFLTAFGLTTLLILKNYYLWHGKVRAAVLLFIFPFLYLMLVGYEILIAVKG